MTPELIAIIAVGLTVVGVVLRQGSRLDKRIDDLKQEVSERFKSLEDRLTQVVEKQQATLEGLLEGLREALTYNRAA